ncbi:TonB-dependent siderophore receptor [Bordetella petrii]|uniref:TonB-dependent siderophore receptor n=1 Tax=Bordetella petrii TaxID=94624 RepID=UPI001E412214|nr:TonB-dependent receptor [Bordetella petrii]MCD0504587.1 TonB-dependent receptor [Bordetella petrii]
MVARRACSFLLPFSGARLSPLALAVCWMAVGALAYSPAGTAHAQTTASGPAARHAFDIPAGSLDQALGRFGRQSGAAISVNATLTAGVQSPGLRGSYTAAQALRQLLAGTGLEALLDASGEYTLRRIPPAPGGVATLAPVTVSGGLDGGEQVGYVTQDISPVGPWEGRDLQDTPYSISAVSADLIENIQATTPDQIFRMMPTTQLSWPQSQNDAPYIFMRGFQSATPARNGLPGAMYGHGTTTEDVERVEILTGLSGFLYGPGNVGGLVNYVSKRPTPERYNSVTVGNSGGPNAYVHGDFGGPIDAAGRFGYRINAVAQDGKTRVDDYTLRRKFVSAAFDWRPTDRLLVQVDGAYRDYRSTRQAYWSIAPGAQRPDANSLDPTRLWSQDWTFFDVESKRLGANLRWEATDAITLRAAYLDRRDTREYAFSTNTVQPDGTYTQVNRITAPQDIRGNAWHAFADFAFNTGPVAHKVTAGYLATRNTRYDHADGQVSAPPLTGLPLDRPTHVPEPDWPSYGQEPSWNGSVNRQASWMIGDDIIFNEQWSMLVGLSRATIRNKSRSSPSADWESSYKDSATTPTVSLIFKPVPSVTTYATYMEALEQGGAAADVYNGQPVSNAGQIMAPLISKQIEVGVKATVGEMLLTGALFQIDKGLQYYDVTNPASPTYVQDGRQVHRGLELTATGRVTPNLTLVGGVTLLDPRVKQQKQDPTLEGKRPVGTANRMFKMYGEYRIPGVSGLSVNAGISYVGASWADNRNTDQLPAYTLVDVGARYVVNAGEYPVTLRLNVNNLTNKRYWVNSQYLGDARTVVLSANVKF